MLFSTQLLLARSGANSGSPRIRVNCRELQPAVRICVFLSGAEQMSYFGRKHRSARKVANEQAWISVEGGFATRQCTVLDISEGGARLRIDDPEFVRKTFRLKMNSSDRGRSCAVAWRDGNEIGVKFLPSAAPRRPE